MASDWNGLPENPERDGWHWISTLPQLPPSPWRWSVADGVGDWFAPGSRWCSPLGAVACHTYLGPCLTPADHAAAVEAAVQAERRACLQHAVDAIPTANPPRTDGYGNHVAGERYAAEHIASRIRARGRQP